jgi:hypothetical protein
MLRRELRASNTRFSAGQVHVGWQAANNVRHAHPRRHPWIAAAVRPFAWSAAALLPFRSLGSFVLRWLSVVSHLARREITGGVMRIQHGRDSRQCKAGQSEDWALTSTCHPQEAFEARRDGSCVLRRLEVGSELPRGNLGILVDLTHVF